MYTSDCSNEVSKSGNRGDMQIINKTRIIYITLWDKHFAYNAQFSSWYLTMKSPLYLLWHIHLSNSIIQSKANTKL